MVSDAWHPAWLAGQKPQEYVAVQTLVGERRGCSVHSVTEIVYQIIVVRQIRGRG
jgi:hypothetical protein